MPQIARRVAKILKLNFYVSLARMPRRRLHFVISRRNREHRRRLRCFFDFGQVHAPPRAHAAHKDVQALIERIEFGVHPDAEAAGYDKMTTIVDIELTDGRTLSGQSDFGKGSPANPMSYEEVAEKFRGCADYARFPADDAKRIVEMVADLERLPRIATLTALLGRKAA